MASFTSSSRFAILALALTLSPALNVLAQSPQSGSSSLGSQLQRAFRPPSSGLPVNRQGGATRNPDSCFVGERQLTALVPTTTGETAAEYPTVFWYMPIMSAEKAPAPELEFTLQDANEQKIYSTKYALTKSADDLVNAPGIMSLKLARPLQVGQEYKWTLRVTCDAKDNSDAKYVVGGLKRVAEDPNLAISVQQASPQERIILYAHANRWYEMLANLVALRRARPNDPTVIDAWNKLFAAQQLNDVSIQSKSEGVGSTNN